MLRQAPTRDSGHSILSVLSIFQWNLSSKIRRSISASIQPPRGSSCFVIRTRDFVAPVDPRDHGNLDTRLEPFRRPAPGAGARWQGIAAVPGVDKSSKAEAASACACAASSSPNWMERISLRAGPPSSGGEQDMSRSNAWPSSSIARDPEAADRDHPLYASTRKRGCIAGPRSPANPGCDSAARTGLWAGARVRRR